jgi:NADH-quinone oxidoreductase subunit C
MLRGLVAGRLAPLGASLGTCGRDPCLDLPAASWREAAEALRDDPAAGYTWFCCLTGIDRHPQEPRFEVLCHLRSPVGRDRLVLRTQVPGSAPSVPSLAGVWRGADWYEREAFDLLGIVFTGHPNLRRILMPADFEGHPLRKEFPLEGDTEGANG